jgi:hypothetical protein
VEKVLKELDAIFREKKNCAFPHKKRKIGKKSVDIGLDARQVMGMMECDVIGVRFDKAGKIVQIYGIESAFHSDGLHYKSTIEKVAAKIVKTILALYLYTGAKNIEVAFVTPVLKKKSIIDDLGWLLSEVRRYFTKRFCARRFKCQIDFYTEDLRHNQNSIAFRSLSQEIFKPVVQNVPFVDDDCELFMRSLLMSELSCGKKLPVRSSLRSALLSVGGSLKRLSMLNASEMKKLNDNEKSAVEGYQKWIERCYLFQDVL